MLSTSVIFNDCAVRDHQVCREKLVNIIFFKSSIFQVFSANVMSLVSVCGV